MCYVITIAIKIHGDIHYCFPVPETSLYPMCPYAGQGLRYLPPVPHTRAMDNDFTATLIPMAVILGGFEWITGFPLLNMLSSYFVQIGL